MVSVIFFILALTAFIFRKDYGREMIRFGFFTLPLILLLPVFNHNFLEILEQTNIFYFLLQIVGIFSLGALLMAGYKFFFHRHLAKHKHPKRHLLAYLAAGPVLLILLVLISKTNFAYNISASLLLDLIIIIIVEHELFIDAIFSGLLMAVTYSISLLILPYVLPGQLNNFWFGALTGLNLFSTPIEEIIVIILFGMLIGPLYVAVSEFYNKKSV